MTQIPPAGDSDDGMTFGTVDGARGPTGRRLIWVVGGILGVAGAVTTIIIDLLHHHHGIGPYLLAAAFLVLFVAARDMWMAERARARTATRSVRRLSARVDRQEASVQHLEHDRDEWRRMQAEEALVNRRLNEELQRVQRPPQVSGGTAGVSSTGPPPLPLAPASPPPALRPPPRHSRRRPPGNQPRLFDQDDEG